MFDSATFFVWKFKFTSTIFFLRIFTTKNVAQCCSSTISSYGDYLFSITIDIYHELSEYLYYTLLLANMTSNLVGFSVDFRTFCLLFYVYSLVSQKK